MYKVFRQICLKLRFSLTWYNFIGKLLKILVILPCLMKRRETYIEGVMVKLLEIGLFDKIHLIRVVLD